MSGIMYGYARVSTRGQHEDRQLAALKEFGVATKDIVVEKQSGKNFDRPLYQVLDMPLLDTREGRDLTGTLVADIVLQLLSYVAQTEREFIHQRQAEGIAAALERGVRFGPDRIPMPEAFEGLAEDWWKGYITATDAGRQLGISRKTFTRRATEWGAAAGLTVRGS